MVTRCPRCIVNDRHYSALSDRLDEMEVPDGGVDVARSPRAPRGFLTRVHIDEGLLEIDSALSLDESLEDDLELLLNEKDILDGLAVFVSRGLRFE